MYAVFFLVCLSLVCASTVDYEAVVRGEWEQFKTQYGKKYEDAETEEFRFKVFTNNKLYVAHHNRLADRKFKTYRLAMNRYGDLQNHEFVAMMNGHKGVHGQQRGKFFSTPEDFLLPTSVDWRSKGYVTPIKNQEQCGSCWAFSATGSLEGQHFRKTGKLVSLSEQQLVDCSGDYGNQGCSGGLMDNAFNYIKANGGIDTEASYPYTAQDGSCQYNPSTIGATDTGFVDIASGDEKQLAEAVATVGPVSVAIDAGHLSFQLYSSGIYNEPDCSSTQLDHGVLAVGFDQDGSGQKYWIVKNSWGTEWGQDGYIFMARDNNNMCGIATVASYPTV